ncbi:MAG: PTS sugar transporter subunit IIB [Nitrososphaeria archaeon]
MGNKVRILVVCGTGIATSTVVSRKIEEKLKEKGIDVETRQCKAAEVNFNLEGVDLIITTTPISAKTNIPIIQTLAFLTGVGEDAVLKQVIDELKGVGKI